MPLVSRQGIFKPRVLSEIPLSITTSVKGPYDDQLSSDGFMLYSYRGDDPSFWDNVGLRKAMQMGTPLVYFHGVAVGKYIPVWPVFIVGDDPESLTFRVAVDDKDFVAKYAEEEPKASMLMEAADFGRRQYVTALERQRLHQRGFRERVLRAYREQCALCRLRHSELLDAAHIIPDGEPDGVPIVENGLALCKLHHAAFDSYLMGIRPDYVIEVRRDILEERDGPMLSHGLKGLHGKEILLPRSAKMKPSPERLEVRYERYLSAVASL